VRQEQAALTEVLRPHALVFGCMLLLMGYGLLHELLFNIRQAGHVVEIGAAEQVPVVLVEGQIRLHALNGDDQSLDHLLAHRLVHGAQVLLHSVERLHMVQVALVLGFFQFFLDG